jgi:hypothetical protein
MLSRSRTSPSEPDGKGVGVPILQIEHGVRDFDAWKIVFDSDPVVREQGACAATESYDRSTIQPRHRGP